MYQNYKETKEKSGGKSFRYKFGTFGHWWSWNFYTKFFILQRQIRHSRIFYFIFCYYVPVNSKTAHPPGQSPGIWLALSSVQWGIWPKMRPARWGIWLSCQNVCQRSETKGFRNSLIQHVHRVHGSLLLSIPRGFFCCCRFYIVEYAFV